MIRFLTAGESHGRSLVVIVEGLPAGLVLGRADFSRELARRRLGFGRGPRMRFEADELNLIAGLRHGRTLGSPVAVEILNSEWERKWSEEMSPDPGTPSRRLTTPRPGHADLAGMLKYGFDDARDVLERASARETAARVVAGACAKTLLASIGVHVVSHVIQIGEVHSDLGRLVLPADQAEIDASEVRCATLEGTELMIAEIKAAAKVGDSLGGVVEVVAHGVPVGLGSHVHWDRKIDGLLGQALLSIQAVKAVSIGEGAESASRRGSVAHDAVFFEDGDFQRHSVRAGGIEGGITVGGPVVVRASMKPLATLNRPVIETVDVESKESAVSFRERTDVTAVPAMGVVAESMVALVLANEASRKFGGDSVAEFSRNAQEFLAHKGETPSRAPKP